MSNGMTAATIFRGYVTRLANSQLVIRLFLDDLDCYYEYARIAMIFLLYEYKSTRSMDLKTVSLK